MEQRCRQRGMSLVESCCAIAVAAVLVGTAAPSFQRMLARRSLEGASAQLAADIHHARAEAVARNRSLRLSFVPALGGSCYVLHTGPAAACRCDGDGDGAAACSGGAQAIKSVRLPADAGVSVAANVASMHFDPVHGTVTPAGTVRVLHRDGPAVHHVVSMLGRVRTCTPDGAIPGLRPC